MITLHDLVQPLAVVAIDHLRNQLRQSLTLLAFQDRSAKPGTPHDAVVDLLHSVASSPAIHKRIILHLRGVDKEEEWHSLPVKKESTLP